MPISEKEIKPFIAIFEALKKDPGIKKTCSEVSLLPDVLISRRHSEILKVVVNQDGTRKTVYIKHSHFVSGDATDRAKRIEQGKREFETAKMVCGLFHDRPQFGLLRPIAYFPETGMIVTEACQGDPFVTRLPRWHDSWRVNSIVEHALPFCRLSGQWLRRLQEKDAQQCRPFLSGDAIPNDIVFRVNSLKEAGAQIGWLLEKGLLEFIERQQHRLKGEKIRQSIIHGDFCPANILVDQQKLTVIDFATVGEGSIYHDLTLFISHLRLLSRYLFVSEHHVDKLEDALLGGYDRVDIKNEPIVQLLLVRHTVCRLLSIAKKMKTASLRNSISFKWQRNYYLASLRKATGI